MTSLSGTNQVASLTPGHLREKMPGVTAWIDSLREAFGNEMVDQMIRTGLRDRTFWAVEKGMVVGRPPAAVLDKHFAALTNPALKTKELPPAQLLESMDRRWPA